MRALDVGLLYAGAPIGGMGFGPSPDDAGRFNATEV